MGRKWEGGVEVWGGPGKGLWLQEAWVKFADRA